VRTTLLFYQSIEARHPLGKIKTVSRFARLSAMVDIIIIIIIIIITVRPSSGSILS